MTIPKIIHFIWVNFKNELDENPIIPENYLNNIENCKKINSDFEIKIWNGKECYLMVEKYFPEKLDLYNSFKYPIQRCDMARLIILYVYGGIYSDMDRYSVNSYNLLLNKYNSYNIILGKYKFFPVLSNDLIVSSKNNKYIYNCINNITNFNYVYYYLIIFITTGPIFLTEQYYSYNNKKEILILDIELNPCDLCNCSFDIAESISFSTFDNNWLDKKNYETLIRYINCNIYQIIIIIFIIIIFIYYFKIGFKLRFYNSIKNNKTLLKYANNPYIYWLFIFILILILHPIIIIGILLLRMYIQSIYYNL